MQLLLFILITLFPTLLNSLDQSETYGFQVKKVEEYRVYDTVTPQRVSDFYYQNHIHQTLDFVLSKKEEYLKLNHARMSIMEAMDTLNQIIDESDPDLYLPQLQHALQAAEAIRRDGHPDWFVLTGFIHDLGKMLIFFNEPQWAVVGDTFPVGCAYSDEIVYSDFFADNSDSLLDFSKSQLGIYEENCGLDKVHMSWGHDEYLYHVVKSYLPQEAHYIIRYHSFYAAHTKGDYDYLMNNQDKEMFKWVKLFNKYDLYSKDEEPLDVDKLLPFYQNLVDQFFPNKINW